MEINMEPGEAYWVLATNAELRDGYDEASVTVLRLTGHPLQNTLYEAELANAERRRQWIITEMIRRAHWIRRPQPV